MKKILSTLLISMSHFLYSAENVPVPSFEGLFGSVQRQSIVLKNNGDTCAEVDLFAQSELNLGLGEERELTSLGNFVFCDTGTETLNVVNVSGASLQLIAQKQSVAIEPGQQMEITVPASHFISGLKAKGKNFSWGENEDKIFAVVEDDSATLLGLYKKYYMENGDYDEEQVLHDFLSQPSGVMAAKRAEEVIFTLTSYPARFATTWLAIESLLRQTERPDRVNLNLFEGEFPGRVLPWYIRQQMTRGLEVNWCPENLKVYLKIIPAMLKFPEASVVAVDDDVFYPNDKLSILFEGHKQYPDCVICSDGRIVKTMEEYILPVNTWNFTGFYPSSDAREPNTDIIPEGVFGVLIPPHAWHEDFTNKDLFFGLCPSDDDLWTYTMSIVNGRKIAKTRRTDQPLVTFEGSQEIESSLWKTNFANENAKLTKCFFDVYQHYNLGDFFENKICNPSWESIKISRAKSLTYNQTVPFQSVRTDANAPLELVDSFSTSEEAGIWTLGESAHFRVYSDAPGFYKLVLRGAPIIHPEKGYAKLTIRKADEVESPEASYMLESQDTQYFSLFTELTEPSELYELSTPDYVQPRSVGINGDWRELGVFLSEFGLYKVLSDFSDINLGTSLDFRAPLVLGSGFHAMEETGLWSSDNAEFSFVFSELNRPYRMNMYGHTFAQSGQYEILQDTSAIAQGVFTPEDPLGVLRFNFVPTNSLTKFLLKITTGNPKVVGESEDNRDLGMFIRRVAVQKR